MGTGHFFSLKSTVFKKYGLKLIISKISRSFFCTLSLSLSDKINISLNYFDCYEKIDIYQFKVSSLMNKKTKIPPPWSMVAREKNIFHEYLQLI